MLYFAWLFSFVPQKGIIESLEIEFQSPWEGTPVPRPGWSKPHFGGGDLY